MNGPLTIRVRIGELVTDRRLDGDALASAIRAGLDAAWRAGAFGPGRSPGRTDLDYVSATAAGHAIDQIGATVASTVVDAVSSGGPLPGQGDRTQSSANDSPQGASS